MFIQMSQKVPLILPSIQQVVDPKYRSYRLFVEFLYICADDSPFTLTFIQVQIAIESSFTLQNATNFYIHIHTYWLKCANQAYTSTGEMMWMIASALFHLCLWHTSSLCTESINHLTKQYCILAALYMDDCTTQL